VAILHPFCFEFIGGLVLIVLGGLTMKFGWRRLTFKGGDLLRLFSGSPVAVKLMGWMVGILLIWFGISLLTTDRTITRNINDAPEMRNTIMNAVPIGSQIAAAQVFMMKNDFSCRLETNATFGNQSGIDFLYCDKQAGVDRVVGRRWQVALLEKDGKVLDVLVTTGFLGP
jgi:hypothetical protein